MRPHLVRAIVTKELREALRDRKNLFLMIFLPILLYPGLLLLVSQVAQVQQTKLEESASIIRIVHASAEHPAVAWLAGDPTLDVAPLDARGDAGVESAGSGSPEASGGSGGSGSAATSATEDSSGVDVLLDLKGWPADLDDQHQGVVRLVYRSVGERSQLAADRVERRLDELAGAMLAERLARLKVTPEAIEPVVVRMMDQSDTGERGGYLLGSILPMLIVITVLLGAYYPAIDLTAGEKERGTIQTLFTAPVSSLEIVAGKYLTVVAIALITGTANLLSMALLFNQNLLLGGDMVKDLDFSIPASTLGVLLIAIVLVALLFSALLLTTAVLARSFKEAQTYTTPVYLLCILPAMVAQLPGFRFSASTAFIPGVNVILYMKEALVEGVRLESLFLITVTSLLWASVILVAASRVFSQERVVIGDRGSFALLSRRSELRDRAVPTAGEGMAWYGVLFVGLFYVGSWLQSLHTLWGVAGTLWLVLAAPTVLVAWYTRASLRETFSLRPASWRGWVGATLLGGSAWIVVAGLNSLVDRWVLKAPPELEEMMRAALGGAPESLGAWALLLFAVSLSPAVCEELVFRGYLWSSLRTALRPWAAVIATALLFGVFHLSIHRLFGTSLLGVALGVLVWRTRSLYPAMWFHALNNGMTLFVAFALFPDATESDSLPGWAIAAGVAGVIAGIALVWGAGGGGTDDRGADAAPVRGGAGRLADQ